MPASLIRNRAPRPAASGHLGRLAVELDGLTQNLLPPAETAAPQPLAQNGDLGALYLRSGRYAQAVEVLRRSLDRFVELHGEGHPQAEGVAEDLAKAEAALRAS